MSFRTSTELSTELREAQVEVRALAASYSLDFFETIFEVIDFDTMNQLAAYGGFPIRYPHWRWGMEYEKLRKRDVYGMGRIYEMVINNDPCYAYLQESNSVTDQKLVMAHVYAHCDFFKCNAWFGATHRNMMDEMANHATRVQRYIDRIGAAEVERFIDACISIETLIDSHSMFVRRREPRVRAKPSDRWEPEKLPAKEYMDRYINPPDVMDAQRDAHEADERDRKKRAPAEPTRDVLLFLLERAPLEDWQRDILSIVREEAYYFAPQAMTKIMNEGWATYWHSKIMTTHLLSAAEVIDYADQHSGVVQMQPGGFNPYKIGLEVFKDIERRWDTGRHGAEWEQLDRIGEREKYDDHSMKGREKIFEVRRIYNDVNFVEEFLTDELVDRLNMYQYKRNPRTGQSVIVSRDPQVVRQVLLHRISNMGQPFMYVVDANYMNRGELFLAHQWNGLEVDGAKAAEVLRGLRRIWGRPVHVQLTINGEMTLLTCRDADSDEVESQPVSDDTPPPAHRVA